MLRAPYGGPDQAASYVTSIDPMRRTSFSSLDNDIRNRRTTRFSNTSPLPLRAEAKVFESAGGYAPTIGIIGAVLGLIQVMKNLANMDNVGRGIAVAFVATIYGIGSANVFFLPAASKLRAQAHSRVRFRELTLEGILGIAEGVHYLLIRIKLEAFLGADPISRKEHMAQSLAARAAPATAKR